MSPPCRMDGTVVSMRTTMGVSHADHSMWIWRNQTFVMALGKNNLLDYLCCIIRYYYYWHRTSKHHWSKSINCYWSDYIQYCKIFCKSWNYCKIFDKHSVHCTNCFKQTERKAINDWTNQTSSELCKYKKLVNYAFMKNNLTNAPLLFVISILPSLSSINFFTNGKPSPVELLLKCLSQV